MVQTAEVCRSGVQESTPEEISVFQQEQDQEWIFFIGTGSGAGAGVIFLAQYF